MLDVFRTEIEIREEIIRVIRAIRGPTDVGSKLHKQVFLSTSCQGVSETAARMKKTILLFAIAALNVLSPITRAVVPPPDGGYPGLNTAEGQNALLHLTAGTGNTALGWFSLDSVTTGSFNTGVGAGTLVLNTGDQNTATGAAALLLNTTGSFNAANGALALLSNTTGTQNTATGVSALYRNTTGAYNTGNGTNALLNNTTGSQNTANGIGTLYANTTGSANTANGSNALFSNTGNNNTALGFAAGDGLTTGSYNIDIGNHGVAGESGIIRIGGGSQTATYVAGIAGQTVGAGGSTCYVDNDGKLGVFLSARRFKTDIADMAAASEALLALRPVTFHYKPELDKTGIPQFGLVAEEVAEVNPDLVTHDAKGDICTVRYEAVNVMLLNEFLKEHKAVQELKSALRKQEAIIAQLSDDRANHQTTISNLGKVLNAVLLRLNEQDSKIQKVNDRLELSEPVTQLALKKP